jgi:hypothetical protein
MAVAPTRRTTPTASVLLDCDGAAFGRAEGLGGLALVEIRGKHGHRADLQIADCGDDLGRDSDVHVLDRDVAYGHVHQPVLLRLGSSRSGEA